MYMDYGGGRLGLCAAVWPQAKVRDRGLWLRPRLNADPLWVMNLAFCLSISKM